MSGLPRSLQDASQAGFVRRLSYPASRRRRSARRALDPRQPGSPITARSRAPPLNAGPTRAESLCESYEKMGASVWLERIDRLESAVTRV